MPSNNNSNTINVQNPKYIESLSKECTELRLKYDNCFNEWFKTVFLSNENNNTNEKICDFEFTDYQKCLFKAIDELDSKSVQQPDGKSGSGVLPQGLRQSIQEAEEEIKGFEKS